MRAVLDADINLQQLAHAREDGVRPRTRMRAIGDLRLPRHAEQVEPFVLIASESGATLREDADVAWRERHTTVRPAAQQHAVAPDDHGAIDERRFEPALEVDRVDA